MPETAIDKYTGAVLTEYHVRFAWQTWIIKSVSETMTPQVTSYHQLRLCVLTMDGGHVVMAL